MSKQTKLSEKAVHQLETALWLLRHACGPEGALKSDWPERSDLIVANIEASLRDLAILTRNWPELQAVIENVLNDMRPKTS